MGRIINLVNLWAALSLLTFSAYAEDISIHYENIVYNIPSETLSKQKSQNYTFYIEKYDTSLPNEVIVYEYRYSCKDNKYKERVTENVDWFDISDQYASPMTPIRKLANKLCNRN